MTKDEALKLALEALEDETSEKYCPAITAIKAALEAKDEPVAYINVEQRKLEWAKYVSWGTPTVVNLPKIPLYTTPPQRKWVGLTDEEQRDIAYSDINFWDWGELMDAVEAKLKEKNT